MRIFFVSILISIVNSRFFRFVLFRASLLPAEHMRKVKNFEELSFLGSCFAYIGSNHSQLNQDVWVLHKTNFKSQGYFVEIGACDPIRLSNTYYLESNYAWNGILVEPNPYLGVDLEEKRQATLISCAVGDRGSIQLYLAQDPEFTTSSLVDNQDRHKLFRDSGRVIEVQSTPLADIFFENNTPKFFDFLSVDVEGSELQALMSNDWEKWRPNYVVVEHNFRKDRSAIRSFMISRGYVLAKENSRFSWDDWFEDSRPRNIE
jgi:FkbM family methyltransferase